MFLVGVLLLCNPALAQDGRVIFERRCASCHAVAGTDALPGPNLRGLFGRRVGGDAAFDYSSVLADAGRRGEVWDAARLDGFLADPEAMYPGLWMGSNGVREDAQRAAVVAFLQSAR